LRRLRPIGAVLAILSFLVAMTNVIPTAYAREADMPFRSIVPNSWKLQTAVNANTHQLASPPTERVTYEARGGDWLVSSGYGGDQIFYRKAILACNGTKWRHIEFEYPASEKRPFDNFVTRTSFALRAYQDVGCGH
jgi:hypothetical protein